MPTWQDLYHFCALILQEALLNLQVWCKELTQKMEQTFSEEFCRSKLCSSFSSWKKIPSLCMLFNKAVSCIEQSWWERSESGKELLGPVPGTALQIRTLEPSFTCLKESVLPVGWQGLASAYSSLLKYIGCSVWLETFQGFRRRVRWWVRVWNDRRL